MANVEAGVRLSLNALGIDEPRTALEMLAIRLACALDNEDDTKAMAALSRELRLTLEQVANQPAPKGDRLDALMAKADRQ